MTEEQRRLWDKERIKKDNHNISESFWDAKRGTQINVYLIYANIVFKCAEMLFYFLQTGVFCF